MKPIIFTLIAALLPQLAFSAAPAVEPVILTELGAKNLGIETIVVEETDFEKTTFALGRTEAIPERRSILSSRIAGRVAETQLKIGAYVEKGEKLVLLESRQPGDPPPTVWLTAPASGTIISVNTYLGAPVEASDSLAEIADLSNIHLIATLPQTSVGKIQAGAQANVIFPIIPEKEYTATLLQHFACPHSYPTHSLNRPEDAESPNLNNASVIFTVENPDNHLRPGMNAEVSVIMEKHDGVLSVPRDAIQGTPASRHVYVKHMTIPNAFDRVNVQTGMTTNDRVEILDGLFPGDEVVTRGSYSLGFAGGGSGVSLKEALDAAHGHEHNEDGSEMSADKKSATETDDHDHAHSGTSTREIIFMISTGILAILLLIISLRRHQPISENIELS